MTAPTREERAEWRKQATRNVNGDGVPVGSDARRVLALLNALDAAERERDAQAAEVNSLTSDWDQEHARAEAAEAAVARARELAEEWDGALNMEGTYKHHAAERVRDALDGEA